MLERLPVWEPDIKHALIVSPHPDDETLGAGGLISLLRQRDVQVTVVAVTDGECAYDDVPELASMRQDEQTFALAFLGVAENQIHRLQIPDSDVSSFEQTLEARLLSIATPDMHVIAPWPGDFHPDHEACGRAATSVAKIKQIPISYYFFWTWHRGNLETLHGLRLASLPLSEREMNARRRALNCHLSQLQHSGGSPILPDYLLGSMDRPFEVFIPAC